MRRVICFVLLAMLLLGIPLTVTADLLTGCIICADSVSGQAGGTVTVPIRISDNPGFTNLAIQLDYDRSSMTLLRLETAQGDTPYLCGTSASVNPEWTDENGISYGYITCASAEPVKENGILFSATFQLSEDFSGSASVTPVVSYIRNNEAVFSVFEEVVSTAESGTVSTVVPGDFEGDGKVDIGDVAEVISAYRGKKELPPPHMVLVDTNGDGVDISEVAEIISVYRKGLSNKA